MAIEVVPEWMLNLDEEDVSFIKKFLLASGSLKEIGGCCDKCAGTSDCS